ncbi:hypothetical protein E8F20_11385 [Pseudomonas sp. BN415]|uniref:hypothetical protein n=1 Tax=Pseudomonas sp. BN415 TaxID=2567889 RepID=UPI0024588AAA|nr:hypothetical protein [Pseudomonas sp. BN415]MDH4582470.1 hypothetical protein [Pseudomonas sp. BN415]
MNSKLTCLLVGATLVLGGCSAVDRNEGARPGVRVADERAPNAGINLDTVVILDKALQDRRSSKLAIENSGARRTATGTLEVFAVIRNRTDHPLQIEARTQFFDDLPVPVEGPTQWQRVYLDPQSVGAYREFSTRAQGIAHYYIEVREGR